MTNREAIEHLKIWVSNYKKLMGKEEYETCSDIVSLEMAIAALEKQEPMKPRLNYEPSKVARRIFGDENYYTCTHCGNVCLKRCSATRNETFYCWNCGQKLDWTEDAE